MYLFGGFLFNIENTNNYANDMAILDTINLRWEQGSSTNAPTSRGYYGAVLLPNQKIIYIGRRKLLSLSLLLILLNDCFTVLGGSSGGGPLSLADVGVMYITLSILFF